MHRIFLKKTSDEHTCKLEKSKLDANFLPKLSRRASCFTKLWYQIQATFYISHIHPETSQYYKSRAEILQARKHQVDFQTSLLHPFSKFRAYYEVWLTLFLWWLLLYLPANGAFDFYFSHVPSEHVIETNFDFMAHQRPRIFELFLKMLSLLDIIVTFRTGFVVRKTGQIVMNSRKVLANYAFSVYFVADLICVIPELVVSTHNEQRIIAALGFIKIVRLPTFLHYFKQTCVFFNIEKLQVLRYFLMHCFVWHWFACVQYFVPQIRYLIEGELSTESWIISEDAPNSHFVTRYLMCLYRALGHLLSITHEKDNPTKSEEILLAFVSYFFGKIYVTYFTIAILHQFLTYNSLRNKYYEILSQLQAYMSQKHLPMPMQSKVFTFYHYKFMGNFFKENDILSTLSEKLKSEINLNVCSKLVQNVQILRFLPSNMLDLVMANLKSEIYLPNDIIIKAGSIGDAMYFLANGTVAVWTPSGKEVCHLHDGAYFGEISLIFKQKRRTANIVAIETCEVYKLNRKTFRNCFKSNIKLLKLLEDVAIQRLEITQMFEEAHATTFKELGRW